MKPLWAFLFFVVVGLKALGAEGEVNALAAVGLHDPSWQPLFSELGARRTVKSDFVEHRWFPFKKIPVVLKGEMRLIPERGVSLHYTEPEERTVIMDEKGLLLRENNRREREVPADPRAPAASNALLSILQFDHEQLERVFVIEGWREGDKWQLDFTPRDPQLAGTLGRIVARGEGLVLQYLEFRRSAMQRVEIFIGETRTPIDFSEADQRRFFR
jgi:hypothetical protein